MVAVVLRAETRFFEIFRKRAAATAKGVLVVLTIAACQLGSIAMTEEMTISSLRISPDSIKLLFDRCVTGKNCAIGVYDLSTGQLSEYRPPANEDWLMAHYSPDGKRIAFVKVPLRNGEQVVEQMQIAVMNLNGKDVQTVTNSPGPKLSPSFSHSGKKIIFIQAGRVQKERRVPTAKHDVYEVEVATGKETQLTNYAFAGISAPSYLPDDTHFIFSAEYPTRFPGVADSDHSAIKMKRNEFKTRFNENRIFIMAMEQQELKPVLVNGEHSASPMITVDGKTIMFISRVKNPNYPSRYFYDIFARTEKGDVVRRTSLDTSSIRAFDLSADGSLIGVLYEPFLDSSYKQKGKQLAVISTRDNSFRVISLPNDARTETK